MQNQIFIGAVRVVFPAGKPAKRSSLQLHIPQNWGSADVLKFRTKNAAELDAFVASMAAMEIKPLFEPVEPLALVAGNTYYYQYKGRDEATPLVYLGRNMPHFDDGRFIFEEADGQRVFFPLIRVRKMTQKGGAQA